MKKQSLRNVSVITGDDYEVPCGRRPGTRKIVVHPTSAFVIKTHTQTVGGGDSSKAKLFINIVKSTHVAEATAKAAVGGQQCSLPIRDRIPSENGRRRCRTTTSIIME